MYTVVCRTVTYKSVFINFKAKTHENSQFLCGMVLECCERKHEDVDRDVQGHLMAQQDLRACNLYKF